MNEQSVLNPCGIWIWHHWCFWLALPEQCGIKNSAKGLLKIRTVRKYGSMQRIIPAYTGTVLYEPLRSYHKYYARKKVQRNLWRWWVAKSQHAEHKCDIILIRRSIIMVPHINLMSSIANENLNGKSIYLSREPHAHNRHHGFSHDVVIVVQHL